MQSQSHLLKVHYQGKNRFENSTQKTDLLSVIFIRRSNLNLQLLTKKLV